VIILIKYRGLDVLAGDIIALISSGNNETITKVGEELDKDNLVTYLNRRYRDKLCGNYEETYDIDELNKFFYEYTGWVQGNDSRKFGIINEDDGLLLILGLIIGGLKLPTE